MGKAGQCFHGEMQFMKDKLPVNGCSTHLVLKVSDLEDTLNELEEKVLADILRKVRAYREMMGKNGDPTYYVCNTDEPYAEEVERTILEGERSKSVFAGEEAEK